MSKEGKIHNKIVLENLRNRLGENVHVVPQDDLKFLDYFIIDNCQKKINDDKLFSELLKNNFPNEDKKTSYKKLSTKNKLAERILHLLDKSNRLYLPLPQKKESQKQTKPKADISQIHEKKDIKIEPEKEEDKVLISLEDIEVKYNIGKISEFQALKKINIKIYSGEFVIFFGPSGCGKSTLLNVIAGLEKPCAGITKVLGNEIWKYTDDELAEYHTNEIGMVFQAYNLIDSLSVEDNVLLPQMFLDADLTERSEKVKSNLEKFGILEHAKKRPAELSGGQQQRVGVARSLINNPKLILADEPMGNLDSKSASTVMKIFKELNTIDKKTVLLVTHNPELLSLANRVLFIKDGMIVREKINNDIRPDKVKKEAYKEQHKDGEQVPKEIELMLRALGAVDTSQIRSLWIPLKAKIISNSIVHKYPQEQISAIEDVIERRLHKLINEDELMRIFDDPLELGGCGLDQRTARNVSRRIKEILEELDTVKNYVKYENEDSDEDKTGKMIVEIRQHLMEDCHAQVEQENIRRLDKFIKMRIDSKLGKNNFIKYASLALKKGGAGFAKSTATKFANELEMLILIKYGEEHKE